MIDWAYVNRIYCLCVWVVAFALLVVIMAHATPASTPIHTGVHKYIVVPR